MYVPFDPTAAGFMLGESRNTPMHVGGLHLYETPADAGPEWLRENYEKSLQVEELAPLFGRRPFRGISTAGQWVWTEDDQFDIEHHVRHSALPAPGRVRELLDLCGRLHGTRLSLERPLWEHHFIEGLADGRIATYSKIHHSMVDGVSAMRLLQASLSTDPDVRDLPPPWAARKAAAQAVKKQAEADRQLLDVPLGAFRSALAISADAAGLPGALVKTLNRGLRNEAAPIALYAPKTVLNRSITSSRRFAAQDWPVDRIRAVGKATRTSINDVVLAMCSGALRQYLIDLDALPNTSLVAMVPMSLKLREAGTASTSGGNAVASIMVRLATDEADPADRLKSIHTSVQNGREALGSMSQLQLIAMSGLGNAATVLMPMLKMQGLARPPYNLVISNVPGPRKPLYWNGARLQGMYPLSIPMRGQALNITCVSYDGQMNFGLTGCRRTAPHLQRLLTHLDDELAALEKAAGIG